MTKNLKLFSYTNGDIKRLIEKIGIDLGNPIVVNRNSQGTEIYLHFNKKIISINKDSKINTFDKPSDYAWLNDKHTFIAWLSNGKLIFKNGVVLNISNTSIPSFDLDAKYFSLTKNGTVSLIYNINIPNKLLAKVDVPYAKIFVADNTVYVIGNDLSDNKRNLLLYIFKENKNQLRLENKTIIKRPTGENSPFYVADMDVDKGTIVIVDQYDMPLSFFSPVFLYNVSASSLKKIGRAKDINLFLEIDIISNFLKKIK
jgi:hypothetical protein